MSASPSIDPRAIAIAEAALENDIPDHTVAHQAARRTRTLGQARIIEQVAALGGIDLDHLGACCGLHPHAPARSAVPVAG